MAAKKPAPQTKVQLIEDWENAEIMYITANFSDVIVIKAGARGIVSAFKHNIYTEMVYVDFGKPGLVLCHVSEIEIDS